MSSDSRGPFQAFTWVLCANSRSCFLTSAQPSSSSCLGQKSSFGSRLDITSSPSTDPTAPHDWRPSHLDPQHWNLSSPSAQTSPGRAAPPGSPSPSANPGLPTHSLGLFQTTSAQKESRTCRCGAAFDGNREPSVPKAGTAPVWSRDLDPWNRPFWSASSRGELSAQPGVGKPFPPRPSLREENTGHI